MTHHASERRLPPPRLRQRSLEQRWVPSPLPGVERVMLDRLGAERGRATSLVRYAPGSSFDAHAHPGGEEILVLQGTFSDESGDHGAGWYLRHPPGSNHRPWSTDGALIFVKLWQMPDSETSTVRTHTGNPETWMRDGDIERSPALRQRRGAGATAEVACQGCGLQAGHGERGAELLVIEGETGRGPCQPMSRSAGCACPAGTRLSSRQARLARPST